MKYLLLAIFLFLTAFSSKGFAKSEEEFIQEYLDGTLDSKKYDKRIAPKNISDPDSATNVTLSMYILDISKVDDDNQEFEAQFYFRQSWNDPRLRFSKDNKMESLILREVDKIWTPDLFFVNEKDGQQNKMLQPNVFCRISSSGDILYSVRVTERLRCVMNLRNFPHDTQLCEIRLESYGFTAKDLILKWSEKNAVGVSPNITEDEFVVKEAKLNTFYETFSSSIEVYSAMTVSLSFQRKFGYYARRLYIPFTFLVLLSWLPLWIKAKEKYLKLTLLLVILYLMIQIASELEPAIPKTPYTKAIDVWVAFCEVMVFAAFLECIASIIIANEAKEVKPKHKGEILCSLDPEGKETDVNVQEKKSGLSKFIVMFEARKGVQDLSIRVDRISRILFMAVFISFNIIYWSVCCSS